jgi:arylsulfatase A-like enzyme
VGIRILWVTIAFDVLLFLLVALGAAVLIRLLRLRISPHAPVILFGFLTFFAWLAVTERIRLVGTFFLALGLGMALGRWSARNPERTSRLFRRTLPVLAGVAALAFLGIEGRFYWRERAGLAALPAAPEGAPNVVVVVVDTLRADHLGSYGYARATSPNIDRLAGEGVLFENAIATSSWTVPSHASMLNGRFPFEQGEGVVMNPKFATLPEVLLARGYRTGAVSANGQVFTGIEFGRGFLRFEDAFNSLTQMATFTLYGRKLDVLVLKYLFEDNPGRVGAADVTHSFLRWVDRNPGVPFFAFLNYFDTHAPYLPPEPYRSKFASTSLRPGSALRRSRLTDDPRLTPAEAQGELDAYDGAIAYVDEQLGRLLEGLRQRGMAESTILVVTSDHGESFGERGYFLHRNDLYRESIHVPLILWGPGRVPQRVRIPTPVTVAAIPATVLDLIGAGEQKEFPVATLAALWKTPDAGHGWPFPLAEIEQFPFEPLKRLPVYHGWMKSLVTPEWHYIVHEKLSVELYSWNRDPAEKNNLAGTSEGSEVVRELSSVLARTLAQSPLTTAGRQGELALDVRQRDK